MRGLIILGLICLLSGFSVAQVDPEAKQLFLTATASFMAEDYTAAEQQFLECRAIVGDDPTVNYNLALVYQRLEAPGRARVYLERCLKRAPNDRAAQQMLQQLLMRLDQPAPPSASWLHALWRSLKDRFTLSQAVLLTAGLNLVAVLVVLSWLFLKGRRWGWASFLVGLLALVTWPLTGAKLADELAYPQAIVVAGSACLRGGPGDDFGEILQLPEGQAVTLYQRPTLRWGPGLTGRVVHERTTGLWCEVQALSGTRGYVRQSLIERF